MKVQKVLRTIGFVAAFAVAGLAQANIVTVNSNFNSVSGGTPKDTGLLVQAGQHMSITVDPSQTWNFSGGAWGYDTNANGALGRLMTIENLDHTNFTAQIGSLVGQIGSGVDAGNYFFVGTNFDGFANASGKLNLMYWDSDAWNNKRSVDADIDVPEPATMALFGLGLLALARTRRRA